MEPQRKGIIQEWLVKSLGLVKSDDSASSFYELRGGGVKYMPGDSVGHMLQISVMDGEIGWLHFLSLEMICLLHASNG